MEINLDPIAQKIEDMIKQKIKDEGLVKTGKLLNSISVKSDGKGGFDIFAEDYFKYLDEEHQISSSVFNSTELNDFITEYIYNYINDSLNK